MLIEFRVSNFKSFNDEQVLSMVASADNSLAQNTIEVDNFGKHRLLKSAVIYGANASGKSNLIDAITFARWFIENSPKRESGAEIPLPIFRFAAEGASNPSKFEFHFFHQKIRYEYGFCLTRHHVTQEWLIAYPNGLPQKWFERIIAKEGDGADWHFGPKLKGDKKRFAALTRPDMLFLSVAKQYEHAQLSRIFAWFSDRLMLIDRTYELRRMEVRTLNLIHQDSSLHELVRKLLCIADVGIDNFILEEKDLWDEDAVRLFSESFLRELKDTVGDTKVLQPKFQHSVKVEEQYLSELSIEDESLGTRRLFAISGFVFRSLIRGNMLIVDELDASLHPLLVRTIVEMFHDPAINSKNAQLIFNTHDTTLLDISLFRRDQIWFVEKDRDSASHLYSLVEFKPRRDEALQKGYLQGRYGAIPFIEGSLEGLVTHAEA